MSGGCEIIRGSIMEYSGIRTSKMTTKTYMAKNGELTRKWFVVDISDKVLGRAAVKIATILMGKHRPEYTPNVDTGDHVIVINAADVRVTGNNKLTDKVYTRYSGYPSGLKRTSLAEMLEKHPERVITKAVKRMLPKTRLGEAMLKKLKVYPGGEHDHQAQQPEELEL
jgi:large subunit ribosomal protein L13